MSAFNESEEIKILVQDLRKLRLGDDENLEHCRPDIVDQLEVRPPIRIRGTIPHEELEAKPPEIDDPFAGCPYPSGYDNSIQAILGHSCKGARAKFCVAFKFFRWFKWIDADVVKLLEPKVILCHYLIWLERTNLVKYRELLVKSPGMIKCSINNRDDFVTRASPHSMLFNPIGPTYPLRARPYYGCPGNSLEENEMLCIIEHGYYNRGIKFCVAFRNYGFWNWVYAFIVWRLKPRKVLKDYMRRLRNINEFRYNILISKIQELNDELTDQYWEKFISNG